MKKAASLLPGKSLLLIFLLLLPGGLKENSFSQVDISVIIDKSPGEKVQYGLGKLAASLEAKEIQYKIVDSFNEADGDIIIIAGLADGDGPAAAMMKTGGIKIPMTAEALIVRKTKWQNKQALLLSGYDDQGLMYALQDAAARITWGTKNKPFEHVNEIIEKPEFATRAISMFTMNRTYWESRFYDEKHWDRYFDMLTQNRFNSLVIILGYENGGFLAPPYPYFFNVDEYPGVRMVGITTEEQRRNLETMNKLIDKAHAHGIKLTLAIWDHIFRGGVQAGGMEGLEKGALKPTEGLVWGVNGDNLIPYTKVALARLIKLMPRLDGVEFRMHSESGLAPGEQVAFWSDVFKTIKITAPEMNFVLRAKDMPESVIQSAIGEKINFRIETKYWMEQMGMPWHPAHVNKQNQMDRRHGYADMLRYPQEYSMYWRLWTGGTIRILLWGNPDYARRFTESAKLYNGDAYEVTEPLATKMESMPHDQKPFDLLNPGYAYYDYEFERYWHFFQVFGRIGYNPDQSPDIWQKEFELRFGPKAGPLLEKAIHEASWILPRIVASCYPYGGFPTTRGWAEKQRLGDLPEYANGGGTDIQVFSGFDDEAKLLIEGGETAMVLPSMTSLWFKDVSGKVNDLVAEAEKAAGKNRTKEFNSTVTDLKILSNLALYHSLRIPAAVNYKIFVRTKDVAALDKAIEYEKNAIEAWRQIVIAAGDVYAENLMMGIPSSYFDGLTHRLTGHWKDELIYLEEGFEKLVQQRSDFKTSTKILDAPEYIPAQRSDNGSMFRVSHEKITSTPAGKPLAVRVKVRASSGLKWVRLRYRSVNQMLEYSTLQMKPAAEKDVFEAMVPDTEINPGFDLMYFIEVMDKKGNGKIYPDMNTETPYVIVKIER